MAGGPPCNAQSILRDGGPYLKLSNRTHHCPDEQKPTAEFLARDLPHPLIVSTERPEDA